MWIHVADNEKRATFIFNPDRVAYVVVNVEGLVQLNFVDGNTVLVSQEIWLNMAAAFHGHDARERYHGIN